MSKESYQFSPEVKEFAHQQAEEAGVKGHTDVHHILPKWFAKKYHLDPEVITSCENAIALETDTFHGWIHGKRLDSYDRQVEWKGFDEEDYVFLATELFGFDPGLFTNKNRR